jgi:hypothetical protein
VAENGGTVAKETIPISVNIQGHWERVNFDIIRISTYDAVLGLLWLEKYNLTINYRDRIMVFDSCGCILIRDTDIEEVTIRAINVYYR